MSGKKSDFALLREDASRIVIGYGLKKVTGKNLYEWYEIYIPKKQKGSISFQDVKDAIIGDIDAQTDEKILKECPWTVLHGDDAGRHVTLWLNAENQRNYSEEQRVAQMTNGANLPANVKVSENEDKTAVYDTFETVEEITQFYLTGVNFIKTTIDEGWQRKDAIDWAPYEALFPQPEPESNSEES